MVFDRVTDLQGTPAGQGNLFPATGFFARLSAAAVLAVVAFATDFVAVFPVLMIGFLMFTIAASARTALHRSLVALSACALGLFVMACGHSVPKAVAYAAADHVAFRAQGTATIAGEGFLRRPNGRLVRCSGNEVFLMPDTPYFREWLRVYGEGNRFEDAAGLVAGHREAVRVTQCDMAGTFRFGQLPAGSWFVATRVSYKLDRLDFRRIDILNDYWTDDALFVVPVETRAGEVSRPVLSNPNRM